MRKRIFRLRPLLALLAALAVRRGNTAEMDPSRIAHSAMLPSPAAGVMSSRVLGLPTASFTVRFCAWGILPSFV